MKIEKYVKFKNGLVISFRSIEVITNIIDSYNGTNGEMKLPDSKWYFEVYLRSGERFSALRDELNFEEFSKLRKELIDDWIHYL